MFAAFEGDKLGEPRPHLGFGCAHLYGGRQANRSLAAVSFALDLGVRYFDTARLYGHGEAEGLLGQALRGRRDKAFIASKAGILPTPNGLGLRLRDKAQRLGRKLPGMEGVIPYPASRHPVFNAFEPGQVRNSVEASLRNLRTDYLDLLLLHECRPAEFDDPDLLGLLEKLREEGKIRGWGAAADTDNTVEIARRFGNRLQVLQFAHGPFQPVLPRIRAVTDLPAVVHSVLGRRLHDFCAAIRAPGDFNRRAAAIGMDGADPATVAPRLLASALRDNPGGVVLFSTSRFDHLHESLMSLEIGEDEAMAAGALATEWAGAAAHRAAELEPAPA